MKEIIINNQFLTQGQMSIRQYKENGKVTVEGILQIEEYFDDIQSIQSDYLLVTGVDVFSEAFGTEDKDIIYNFKAEVLNLNKELLTHILIEEGDDDEQ